MPPRTYSELQVEPIRATIARLELRVIERFPGSGLGAIAAELVRLGAEVEREVALLRRPLLWVRALSALAVAAILALSAWATARVAELGDAGAGSLPELLEGLDAGFSLLVLAGLTVLFFVSLETRFKRQRALRTLYRLRGLAHIVDMHQLTKDPDYALGRAEPTASSPERALDAESMVRYLDYCSEMLALVGKLAALHAERLQDSVVLEAVNDVETLATSLAGNIWQKLTILDAAQAAAESGPRPRREPGR